MLRAASSTGSIATTSPAGSGGTVATCFCTSAVASATSWMRAWLRTKLIVQPAMSSSDSSASSE